MSDVHEAIREILISGQFDQLIGRKESPFLEVKGSNPYDLSTPSGRFELAKDVTALANSEGGFLLIGFTHEKLRDERTDQINGLDMFDQTKVGTGQLAGVIKTNTYPQIQGLSVDWLPSAADPTVGIVAVYVPPQAQRAKLFLITKVAEEEEPQRAIIVGIARRLQSDNVPLTSREIYEAIQNGRDSVLNRATRIEEKLDTLLGRAAATTSPMQDQKAILESRLAELRIL